MVDRRRRDAMAELLRHFVDGLLSNDEFEQHLDEIFDSPKPVRRSDDPALWAIRSRAWFLYDDIRTHRLKGKWAISEEERRDIARWIVFLYSDCEYEWPVRNFIGFSACILNVLTLGLAGLVVPRVMRRRYEKMGDWAVWPFIRRSDYDRALAHPRLLARNGGVRE